MKSGNTVRCALVPSLSAALRVRFLGFRRPWACSRHANFRGVFELPAAQRPCEMTLPTAMVPCILDIQRYLPEDRRSRGPELSRTSPRCCCSTDLGSIAKPIPTTKLGFQLFFRDARACAVLAADQFLSATKNKQPGLYN